MKLIYQYSIGALLFTFVAVIHAYSANAQFAVVPEGTFPLPQYEQMPPINIDRGNNKAIPDIVGADTGGTPLPSTLDIQIKNADDITEKSLLVEAFEAQQQGHLEPAIALYKMILKDSPKNRTALFGLAVSYHKLSMYLQAKDAYANLLTHYPTHQEGLNNYLSMMGELSPYEALIALDNLEASNPGFKAVKAHRAKVHMRLGNKEAALRDMSMALQDDPSNLTTRYNMAVMLDQVGNKKDAMFFYNQILQAAADGQKIPVAPLEIRKRMSYLQSR